MTVPRQSELAGLEPPTCPGGGCLPLPCLPTACPLQCVPSLCGMLSACGQRWLVVLLCYVGCRLNLSLRPRRENKSEGNERRGGSGRSWAGGCWRSPREHSTAWGPRTAVSEMGLESRRGAGGEWPVADRGS